MSNAQSEEIGSLKSDMAWVKKALYAVIVMEALTLFGIRIMDPVLFPWLHP